MATLKHKVKNLSVVSPKFGNDRYGLTWLLRSKQISKVYVSFLGDSKQLQKQYFNGEIEVHLMPQGNMAEKIRAGGSGIPAFYSPTGIGTDLEYGTMAVKYSRDGKTVLKHSQPRESRFFNGKKFLLEEAITGDFAFVKCWKADKAGNLVFKKTARNFNPDIATAAKIVIAEAEEIVEIGELDPD